MKKLLLLLNIITLIGILSSCNSNNLGNNIYLLEGDRKEDRIIVECTGKSFSDCIGGTYLIPKSYKEHISNGYYSEFVDNAKANEDYIFASTVCVNNGIRRYWIIDKKKKKLGKTIDNNSSYILGTLDLNSFLEERKKSNIRLNF